MNVQVTPGHTVTGLCLVGQVPIESQPLMHNKQAGERVDKIPKFNERVPFSIYER